MAETRAGGDIGAKRFRDAETAENRIRVGRADWCDRHRLCLSRGFEP